MCFDPGANSTEGEGPPPPRAATCDEALLGSMKQKSVI